LRVSLSQFCCFGACLVLLGFLCFVSAVLFMCFLVLRAFRFFLVVVPDVCLVRRCVCVCVHVCVCVVAIGLCWLCPISCFLCSVFDVCFVVACFVFVL